MEMTPLWHVGDRIQDRWEVHHVRPGRMGLVYIVYDHETHLPYAAKTLHETLVAREATVTERFVQSAQAWIHLDAHRNVTQAHFVEIINAQPLLFLDYVSGGDLRDWIGIPRLTRDVAQVVRFAMQVCDALLHALAGGITSHRDIKPSNCLITPDGTLKVTDFQCAAVLDGVPMATDEVPEPSVHRLHIGPSRTGTVAGTCTHMAPELFDDPHQADVRTDIYAFGVLLFQMATGTLPFTGQTWQEVAHLHRTQLPPSLSPPFDVLGRNLSGQTSGATVCRFSADTKTVGNALP
jgi:serine/threonine protein kinase